MHENHPFISYLEEEQLCVTHSKCVIKANTGWPWKIYKLKSATAQAAEAKEVEAKEVAAKEVEAKEVEEKQPEDEAGVPTIVDEDEEVEAGSALGADGWTRIHEDN